MKNILLILPLVLFLISCEKEQPDINPQIPEDTLPRFTLIAGEVFHDSIDYHEFNPAITVKGKRIGVDTNYVYHDSVWIDLNDNIINDVFFEYYRSHFQPSCDCEGIDCCMPSDQLYCWIRTKSNLEIATKEIWKYDIPIRLGMGDTIDDRYNWISFEERGHFDIIGWTNEWRIDHYNSFMGFRMVSASDTLYGWLRINTHYLNSFEIYDYTIQK